MQHHRDCYKPRISITDLFSITLSLTIYSLTILGPSHVRICMFLTFCFPKNRYSHSFLKWQALGKYVVPIRHPDNGSECRVLLFVAAFFSKSFLLEIYQFFLLFQLLEVKHSYHPLCTSVGRSVCRNCMLGVLVVICYFAFFLRRLFVRWREWEKLPPSRELHSWQGTSNICINCLKLTNQSKRC